MSKPICERLSGRYGYFEEPMNPPPAEKNGNVVQFALTSGCSRNKCTFCNMYKDVEFQERPIDEFVDHVDRVVGHLSRFPFGRFRTRRYDRIFIGGGNALSVNTAKLMFATQYTLSAMTEVRGSIPRRLSLYGNVTDVLKHGEYGLSFLRCGGICGFCSAARLGERRGVEVVYLGLESGCSDVLRIAGKGYDEAMAGDAAYALRESDIRTSVMVMPGLGGISYFDKHVQSTTRVINELNPEWVTFIGLMITPGTPYANWISREEECGTNRRLTDKEIVEQTAQMIEGLRVSTKVGVHGDDVHTFGHNPVSIGMSEVDFRSDRCRVADKLREKANLID